MNETPPTALDHAAFQRVWQRVMPQDRADCPFTLDPPALPTMAPEQPAPAALVPLAQAPASTPVCLGEASAGQLPLLGELLGLTMDCARIYRALERRWGRRNRRGLLSALADEKARQVRRLSAAYFLISGQEYPFTPTPAPTAGSLALALRERFQAEQLAAAQLLSAAQAAADPCLSQLYRDLAEENQAHASLLRTQLETM